MAAITWDDLRNLAQVRAAHGTAVSLYLDLDPGRVPTWTDVRSRVTSLLSAAGHAAGGNGKSRTLRDDIQRIERFFEGEFDREGTAGIAVFAGSADGIWRELPLPRTAGDAVAVDEELLVRPLVPLAGSVPEALVALVNRRRGSLFALSGGVPEPAGQVDDDDAPSRHDQGGWSQANYQRSIDERSQRHYRDVAAALERAFRALGRPPVVLVCTEDERRAIEDGLAADVAAALIGWTSVESHSTAAGVAAAARPFVDELRLREQASLVARLDEEIGQGGRAARGFEDVFRALGEARVSELLYDGTVRATAYRCPECGRGAASDGRCALDGTRLETVEDGLDLAVRRALAQGSGVCEIEDPVALAGEPVCALLRW